MFHNHPFAINFAIHKCVTGRYFYNSARFGCEHERVVAAVDGNVVIDTNSGNVILGREIRQYRKEFKVVAQFVFRYPEFVQTPWQGG